MSESRSHSLTLLELIASAATSKYDFRSLKLMVSGAAPLGASLVELAVKKLSSIGATVDIMQGPTFLNFWTRIIISFHFQGSV